MNRDSNRYDFRPRNNRWNNENAGDEPLPPPPTRNNRWNNVNAGEQQFRQNAQLNDRYDFRQRNNRWNNENVGEQAIPPQQAQPIRNTRWNNANEGEQERRAVRREAGVGRKRRNVYCNSNFYNIAFSNYEYTNNLARRNDTIYTLYDSPRALDENYIFNKIWSCFGLQIPSIENANGRQWRTALIRRSEEVILFNDNVRRQVEIVHDIHRNAANSLEGIYINLLVRINDENDRLNLPLPTNGAPANIANLLVNDPNVIHYELYPTNGLIPIMHYSYHFTNANNIRGMNQEILQNFFNGTAHVKFNSIYTNLLKRLCLGNSVDVGRMEPYLPITFNTNTSRFYNYSQMTQLANGINISPFTSITQSAQNTNCNINQNTPKDLQYFINTGGDNSIPDECIEQYRHYLKIFLPLFEILYNSGVRAMNSFVTAENNRYNPRRINAEINSIRFNRTPPVYFDINYDGPEAPICVPNNCLNEPNIATVDLGLTDDDDVPEVVAEENMFFNLLNARCPINVLHETNLGGRKSQKKTKKRKTKNRKTKKRKTKKQKRERRKL